MKLNNKGFALTSIIYMLIVLFLMILLLILANLAQRKVVLDKIKNDVKTNLNQGGLLAKNTYTVTFDPTIGQINQTSKQVTYNEPYGELPTPTREGYKFIGWTSKNLAPEINENNYTSNNYNNSTTSEFRNENGTNYIRINGNSSNENIDTLWILYSENIKNLNQGEYTLSFDVRSENAKERQSIRKRTGNTDGKTGIYINSANINNMISNIENDYIFDNDGQWHHFTSKVTIPYDTKDSLIAIGNDVPNLYGENSYIDIKNIQLEPGDTATSYEPYQEYTSDTIVTKQENHTLYAMWEPLYMVTFDSNGGTLSETTKWVEYNEPYGELPAPTREGFAFKGWNGKNLFDKDNAVFSGLYPNSDTGKVVNTTSGKYLSIIMPCEPNTTYIWSFDKLVSDLRNRVAGYADYPAKGMDCTFLDREIESSSGGTRTTQKFTTTADTHWLILMITGTGQTIETLTTTVAENAQLEIGSEMTEYESYFIIPTTIVTQEKDHILHAIWEPNE